MIYIGLRHAKIAISCALGVYAQNLKRIAVKRSTLQVDGSFIWLYNTYTTERTMQYTLITETGRVYTFYLEAVALTYQKAYGGKIVTKDILVDKTAQKAL